MRSAVMSRSWLQRAAGCTLVLMLAGCAAPAARQAAGVAASPVPAGAARIWFYREFEPSVSLNLANVSLNGVLAASVQPDGSAMYRDVAPGHYHVTVESVGRDINQDKDVDLAPGQEAFVKILALAGWEAGFGRGTYQRDTFYVSLVPPQVARAELATHPLSGG